MSLLRRTTRTVTGPTDDVVIVGAGLAGLSCALRLAGAGRNVTVLERESVPGGRAGLIEDSGFRFDTGPTVLTMPDLIRDAFASVGEDMDDWLELVPVEPLYRAFYPDGSQLDVHSNVDAMADEIERVISPDEAAGYRRYVDFVSKLYRYEMSDFIDTNIDSPLDLVTANLAKLAAIGGFRKLAPKVRQYLKDPRTERLFSFQSMYAGLSPQDALAIYAIIAYMDYVAGVYDFQTGNNFNRGYLNLTGPSRSSSSACRPTTCLRTPPCSRSCRSTRRPWRRRAGGPMSSSSSAAPRRRGEGSPKYIHFTLVRTTSCSRPRAAPPQLRPRPHPQPRFASPGCPRPRRRPRPHPRWCCRPRSRSRRWRRRRPGAPDCAVAQTQGPPRLPRRLPQTHLAQPRPARLGMLRRGATRAARSLRAG